MITGKDSTRLVLNFSVCCLLLCAVEAEIVEAESIVLLNDVVL